MMASTTIENLLPPALQETSPESEGSEEAIIASSDASYPGDESGEEEEASIVSPTPSDAPSDAHMASREGRSVSGEDRRPRGNYMPRDSPRDSPTEFPTKLEVCGLVLPVEQALAMSLVFKNVFTLELANEVKRLGGDPDVIRVIAMRKTFPHILAMELDNPNLPPMERESLRGLQQAYSADQGKWGGMSRNPHTYKILVKDWTLPHEIREKQPRDATSARGTYRGRGRGRDWKPMNTAAHQQPSPTSPTSPMRSQSDPTLSRGRRPAMSRRSPPAQLQTVSQPASSQSATDLDART
jgi:hypothetical protein